MPANITPGFNRGIVANRYAGFDNSARSDSDVLTQRRIRSDDGGVVNVLRFTGTRHQDVRGAGKSEFGVSREYHGCPVEISGPDDDASGTAVRYLIMKSFFGVCQIKRTCIL